MKLFILKGHIYPLGFFTSPHTSDSLTLINFDLIKPFFLFSIINDTYIFYNYAYNQNGPNQGFTEVTWYYILSIEALILDKLFMFQQKRDNKPKNFLLYSWQIYFSSIVNHSNFHRLKCIIGLMPYRIIQNEYKMK